MSRPNNKVSFGEADYRYLAKYLEYKLQEENNEYDSKEEILAIQYSVYKFIEEKNNLKRRIGPIAKNKDKENRLINLDSTQIKNGDKLKFYRGDSLNTPLYLIELLLNQNGKYMEVLKEQHKAGCLEGHLELNYYKPGNFSKLALNYFPKNLEEFSEEDFKAYYGIEKREYVDRIKLINDFCELYSNVGNMIVLIDDKVANTNKSGNFADHDTGTQMLIQVDYYFKNNEVNGKFLSQSTTKEWVDSYRSFKNFINAFALEDYVDENYNVKVMFKGQSIHNLKPQTANEAQQSLKHLIDIIKKREKRVLNLKENALQIGNNEAS